ncbi:hypothetical protein RIF29_39008 [Crotalaria pallida]|uniref:Uncharacterized protein n=1 Tax=Crotalaria pallida TaxID=3830 RepID=A0AAN9E120_CROPI
MTYQHSHGRCIKIGERKHTSQHDNTDLLEREREIEKKRKSVAFFFAICYRVAGVLSCCCKFLRFSSLCRVVLYVLTEACSDGVVNL